MARSLRGVFRGQHSAHSQEVSYHTLLPIFRLLPHNLPSIFSRGSPIYHVGVISMRSKGADTMSRGQQGFTVVGTLSGVLLVGILALLVVSNYLKITRTILDRAAQSDYLNVKVAIRNALEDPETPNRFMFMGVRGPTSYRWPLEKAAVSTNVIADVFHSTRRRKHRRPTTITRIDVYHEKGRKKFRYTEVNGKIVAQVLAKKEAY